MAIIEKHKQSISCSAFHFENIGDLSKRKQNAIQDIMIPTYTPNIKSAIACDIVYFSSWD
jgi:hypothetical protein